MNKRQRKKNFKKYMKLIKETCELFPPPQYLIDGNRWKYFVKTARERRISNDKASGLMRFL